MVWNELTFDELNERLKNNTTLELVSMEKDNSNKTICELHCTKCNHNYKILKVSALYTKGCSVCKNRIVIKGFNDIATTEPWALEYFKNKNDAYENSKGSSNKVNIKCPICGKIKYMAIQHFFYYGFRCDYCSDKVSFPNKFSRALLLQLPISNLKTEYSPKWISPKRYDNYFEYNGNKYILEMDGGFHYMDNTYNENIKLKDVQRIDSYKDEMALLHNIEVIRIDCRSLSPIEIQHKIEESKLSKIFDLSTVDWQKCQIDSTKNLILEACSLFKSKVKVKDIAEILKISRCTVREYLKKGNEIGIINYNTKMQITNYKIIDVYKESDNSFIGTYNYYNTISKELFKLNPNEIYNQRSIRKHVLNHTPYKGYIFIERDNINE